MTQRERFEAWATDGTYLRLKQHEDGGYESTTIDYAWEAWQASSASSDALVRQLLEAWDAWRAADGHANWMQRDRLDAAIDRAREHLGEKKE